MNGFNFLSGMQNYPGLQYQLGTYSQPQQYLGQAPMIANPSQWGNGGFNFATGEQGGIPSYLQNQLSNQGAAGFSLGDRLKRFQSGGGMSNLGLGLTGLNMMLGGWGSHS